MKALTPRTSDGRPIYAFAKPDLPRRQIYSHDWTDRTTWFSHSTSVVNEAATFQSGSVWTLAHGNVIDTYHGKLIGEDYLGYRVSVTVDGAAKVECDPHDGAGDYTVDYDAGTIAFVSAPASNADVRATYHYAGDSTFTVAPNPGKRLTIEMVEVQFSADVIITDTARFQVWVYAPPELGFPPGTKVPYGEAAVYKTIRNYLDDAQRSYPRYEPLGGNGWRGMQQPVVVFDWDYLSAIPLKSSVGAEIRVSLDHHTPFGGTYATASFYCVEVEE